MGGNRDVTHVAAVSQTRAGRTINGVAVAMASAARGKLVGQHGKGAYRMIDARTAPFGAALLRMTMGAWFLVHIAFRFLVFGWPATAAWFQSVGIPETLGAFVTLVETLGGIALLVGLATRISSVALLVVMLGTIVSYHGANGFLFTNPKGGWEYPALWAVALVAQALIGPGHLAVDTVLRGYRLKAAPSKLTDRIKA